MAEAKERKQRHGWGAARYVRSAWVRECEKCGLREEVRMSRDPISVRFVSRGGQVSARNAMPGCEVRS